MSLAVVQSDARNMLQLRYCMYQTSSGCFLKPRPSARMLLPPDTRFSCSNQHRSSDTLTLTYKVHKCALNASDEKGASTQIETLLRDRLSARCSKDAYEQLDQTVAFLQAVPEVQLVEFAIGERLHAYQQQVFIARATSAASSPFTKCPAYLLVD